ncbi:MAG: class I SAM-dependent methyltransferase [Thiogranum sp.]|nr:class I SAM-dependent methyltransferase [Thiogranum sp.]
MNPNQRDFPSGPGTPAAPEDPFIPDLSAIIRALAGRQIACVIEAGEDPGRPLTAALGKLLPVETLHDAGQTPADVAFIHPHPQLTVLVQRLYAVRETLTPASLLCGAGGDRLDVLPALHILLQQFIEHFRVEDGFWIARPQGIEHLQSLPPFKDIAHLVQQVEVDLQAEMEAADAPAAAVCTEPVERVSGDAVADAVRLLLEREPRGPAEIDVLVKGSGTLSEVRNRILRGDEFKRQNAALFWHTFSANEAPMQIQLNTTDHERGLLLEHIQSSWEHLGATEPHWSVLTNEQFRQEHIAENEEAFYQSGKHHVDALWRSLQRVGVDPSAFSSCLEYGCGLGRVTRWLAERFDTVYGYDISSAHLQGAGNYLARAGIDNVVLQTVTSPAEVAQLAAVDVVYSLIVLQHNPPPVIALIVHGLLAALNPGGVAYFQVPTYQRGYSFSSARYLSAAQSAEKEIEMHVLPQSEIFAIARQNGAQVLEVFEDACTGIIDGGRSNTFIIQKNR